MAQKSGNNVKAPVHQGNGSAPEHEHGEIITEQHHGENTKSLQDDKKIGQHNGAGRPPLMKK